PADTPLPYTTLFRSQVRTRMRPRQDAPGFMPPARVPLSPLERKHYNGCRTSAGRRNKASCPDRRRRRRGTSEKSASRPKESDEHGHTSHLPNAGGKSVSALRHEGGEKRPHEGRSGHHHPLADGLQPGGAGAAAGGGDGLRDVFRPGAPPQPGSPADHR